MLNHQLRSLLYPGTISINSINMLIRACFFLSLDDYQPSNCFQYNSNRSKKYENTNIGLLPVLLAAQSIKSLEDVNNAQNHGSVSNGVVVYVPIQSVFVVWLGPQEQGEHLQTGQCIICQKTFHTTCLEITSVFMAEQRGRKKQSFSIQFFVF